MNRVRAKEILAGYRPRKDDATDPELVSALALLERDTELASWYERERAFDAALRLKLREIPIPIRLRARILEQRPDPRARPAWWREPSLVSAAAAVLVVLGTSAVWFAPWRPGTWSHYQTRVVRQVTQPYAFDVESRDPAQVRQVMAAAGYPADFRIPPGLSDYPLEGGFTTRWRGHKVSVVCYGSDEQRKPDVWLIVVKQTAFSGAPRSATPELGVKGKSRMASWADDGHLYVLVTQDGPDLKGLLQP